MTRSSWSRGPGGFPRAGNDLEFCVTITPPATAPDSAATGELVLPSLLLGPASPAATAPAADAARTGRRRARRAARPLSARASQRLIERRVRHSQRSTAPSPTSVRRQHPLVSLLALAAVATFVGTSAVPLLVDLESAAAETPLSLTSAIDDAQEFSVTESAATSKIDRDNYSVRQVQNNFGTSMYGAYPINIGAAVQWPLQFQAVISDGYRCRSTSGGKCTRFHYGLDFLGPYRSSINSVAAGKVVAVGWYGSYGNRVEVYHPDLGVKTLYAHMSAVKVKEGQRVEAGQLIGLMGSTGLSTANHLHLEVWDGGARINPYTWLRKHAG